MSHSSIKQQLQKNLQLAYRQALDADAKLDKLKQAGQGKFSTIFTQDQGFNTQSNRFLPYVQELAEQLTQLPTDLDKLPTALEQLVQKLAKLLAILQTFKAQTKE